MGAQAAPKVFRLRDILTKEVSIVDRAANKRTWLVRKNADGQPLEPDGKGGFVAAPESGKPAEPAPAPAPAPADPAQPAPAPAPADPKKPADPAPAQPADPAAPVEVTEKTHAALVKAVEQLSQLARDVKPTKELTIDSAAITEKVAEALDGIELVAERQVPEFWEDGWKCDAQTLHKALKTASAKLAEVADSLAVATGDDPPPHELRWRIVDVLDNLVEYTRFEVAQRAMEKREGADAAQFAALVKGLSAVLGEELAERVDPDEATRLVSAADEVIKAQSARIRKQQQRIEALEAQPQISHRLPVGESAQSVRKTNEVTWPRDMNDKSNGEDLSFA